MTITRLVRAAVDLLASETWHKRHEPGELDRLHEIRALVEQQLADDNRDVRGRVGRQWVAHYRTDEWLSGERPSRTPTQLALEEGVRPFIEALTGEDRVLVWLRYDRQRTLREIASEDLHVDHETVRRRLITLRDGLRDAILRAYPKEVEE